ncbi:MAG: hypothetical protein H7319_20620 [Spirosoma sp.]|nr:hypothetical protein [Spirosoma sp.]
MNPTTPFVSSFSATITFPGDASVGLPDLTFVATIPDFREQFGPGEKMKLADMRAITRDMMANFYQSMNDEGRPSVTFSDESEYEGDTGQEWGDDFERSIDRMPFENEDNEECI